MATSNSEHMRWCINNGIKYHHLLKAHMNGTRHRNKRQKNRSPHHYIKKDLWEKYLIIINTITINMAKHYLKTQMKLMLIT